MAKALDTRALFGNAPPRSRSLQAVWTLRLTLGLTALLGAIIFLQGTSWDIQWHSFIGRDRTLIPPHLMMLSGVTLSGVAGLLTVIIESVWARRSTIVAQHSTNFAGIFYGPLGAYVVGFAALNAAIAFPLDAYWHALYGIDVAIWAPFHVMFVAGMAIVAIGAAYMLAAAAHIAVNNRQKNIACTGTVIALGTFLSIFTLLLFDAFSTSNIVDLGFAQISLFPLLSGLLVTFVLLVAVYAIPWRWAATAVASVYLLMAGIMAVFVQPATDWLLTIERLSYRRAHPPISVVTLEWILTPIIIAILLDAFILWGQQKDWSSRKMLGIETLIAMISTLPILIARPTMTIYIFIHIGLIGFIISYLLGLITTFVAAKFGHNVGEALSSLER